MEKFFDRLTAVFKKGVPESTPFESRDAFVSLTLAHYYSWTQRTARPTARVPAFSGCTLLAVKPKLPALTLPEAAVDDDRPLPSVPMPPKAPVSRLR